MTRLTPFSQASEASSFPIDFEQAMHRLRGSLTDLLAAGGEDPSQPQALSRRLKINKNLAWKVCKIVNSTDSYAVAQHVPGSAGIRILLGAFEKLGVAREFQANVSRSIEAFDHMIRVHVGDRSNLELYVGSVLPGGIGSSQLEMTRRMAFQGNSVIWGVQARVAFTLKAVSPTPGNPDRADLTTIGGLLDFRRLRPTASWPLLRQGTFSVNADIGSDATVPIDPAHSGEGAPLITEFCSTPLAETRMVVEGETTTYELCEGPVGKTAAADVVFGSLVRSHVPVFGESEDSVGEHYCRMDTPVELVHFDLLVHRSLPFEMPPQIVTYSAINGDPQFPLSRHGRNHLPGTTKVQALGNSLHRYATPHIARYGQMVTRMCDRIGYPLEEFDGYRVTLSYPPLPSIFVMHHKLGMLEPKRSLAALETT